MNSWKQTTRVRRAERGAVGLGLVATLIAGVGVGLAPRAQAADFADAAFRRVWARTDQPVADLLRAAGSLATAQAAGTALKRTTTTHGAVGWLCARLPRWPQ